MDAAEKARRAAIVARAGDRVVTVGELEERMAGIPRFQLLTFGSTPEAIRRKFLEDVVLPEVLLAKGADDAKLAGDPDVDRKLERALSSATMRASRERVPKASDISMDEVRRYYEANRSHFDTPERYGIWRILCKTREDAVAVLEAAKKDATPQKFSELAREHSVDKATNMRGGNLGFLGADGTSSEAGLKADPAIVKAALGVKDGELVPAPVAEGPYFAVVWRRGTVGAMHRTPEDAKEQIQSTLFKQKLEDAGKELLDTLRARDLHDYNPSLVDSIEVTPGEGNIVPRRRQGQVPPLGAIGSGRAPAPK